MKVKRGSWRNPMINIWRNPRKKHPLGFPGGNTEDKALRRLF